MRRQTTLLAGVARLLLCLCCLLAGLARAQGFDGAYRALQGDADGDGRTDLYITRAPRLLLVGNADAAAPLLLKGDVADFYLRQTAAGKFELADDAFPPGGAPASGWQPANVNLQLLDVNSDGRADLLLGGLASLAAGAAELIVYAPGTTGSAPVAIRSMDSDFRQFVRELYRWSGNPDFFEDTVPFVIQTVTETTWTYLGYSPYYIYPPQCRNFDGCWYLVDDVSDPGGHDPVDQPGINVFHYWGSEEVSQTQSVPDYSVFNPHALAVANAFGSAATLPVESSGAEQAMAGLGAALGADYGPQAAGFLPGVLPQIGVILGEEGLALLSALRIVSLAALLSKFLDLNLEREWLYHYTRKCDEIADSGQIGLIPGNDVFLTPDVYFTGARAQRQLSLPLLPACVFIVDKTSVAGLVGPQTVAPKFGQPGGGLEYVGLAPVFPENRDPVPLPAR